jgi:putative FmdB family regulatory protein
MPIYEYKCEACAETFEKFRRMQDNDADVRCPKCDSERVERKYSAFATSGCSPKPGGGFT